MAVEELIGKKHRNEALKAHNEGFIPRDYKQTGIPTEAGKLITVFNRDNLLDHVTEGEGR